MSTAQKQKVLEPVTPVKTDFSNLHKSKEQFINDRRKQKELEARLKIESERIKKEINENNQDEAIEFEDENALVTVETVTRKKKNK